MIGNHQSIDVFIGLDVGKGEHHAVAVDRMGMKLFDKALPNDEARLREILTSLGRHGRILLVVDQPATIGALPVAADVGRALRVPYVSIQWLTEDSLELIEFGEEPAGGSALYEVPLTYRGEHVGRLRVANRGPGERFSPGERRLLADLSRQIGAAAHELALSTALQHSRERLVLAREEERRVIRRTLHDDIGPTIAGIALRAETARQLADRPTERVGMTTALAGIGRDAATAASALRELSYELRPPALDDRGLLLALRDQAVRLAPLRVEITALGFDAVGMDGRGGDLPAAVEVAAFRIAVAAITNTARHAAASRCWVTLTLVDDQLTVLVEDDGRGLPADFRPGVGVLSMRERSAELGGLCVHEQRSGGGTRVRATLPITGGTQQGVLASDRGTDQDRVGR